MGLDYRVKCCPDGLMTDRRHNVRVFDCTIRDGGCCNDWNFSDDLVRRTFLALRAAGVDYMEIGYQSKDGIFDPKTNGKWRFCSEDDLRSVAESSGMKLSTMLDFGRADIHTLRPKKDSIVDVIRVACYAKDVDATIDLLMHAQALGYEVFCNVMAVSTLTPREVDEFLQKLHNSTIPNVALVDSFGALYPHHIRYLVRKYKNFLRPDQKLAVHLHNNQETAFANSIVAVEEGADIIDATVYGIGRGAGNCPIELLLMYLDTPRYDLHPILDIAGEFAALKPELRWGYHVPYAITGWLNQHPNSGIDRVRDRDRQDNREFFDKLTMNRSYPQYHRPIIGTGTPAPAPDRVRLR
jgi:4-hydroxy 2-oxovalerate aldolase